MAETADQQRAGPLLVNGVMTTATPAAMKTVLGAGNVFTLTDTCRLSVNGLQIVFRAGVPYALDAAMQARLTALGVAFAAA